MAKIKLNNNYVKIKMLQYPKTNTKIYKIYIDLTVNINNKALKFSLKYSV